jgi:hypothetical protein
MTTRQTAPPPPAQWTAPNGEVIARPSTEYRVKRYLMVALVVGFGFYFLYDGYIGWPAHNARVADVNRRLVEAEQAGDDANASQLRVELSKMKKPYTGKDLLLQKFLGYTLPPLGLALLAWTFHNSRGRYVLRNDTLEVPGHPPVPLSRVRRIDRQKWDRKGIAYLDYELEGGTKGTVRLDDFIYERVPTDEIFKRVENAVAPGEQPTAN